MYLFEQVAKYQNNCHAHLLCMMYIKNDYVTYSPKWFHQVEMVQLYNMPQKQETYVHWIPFIPLNKNTVSIQQEMRDVRAGAGCRAKLKFLLKFLLKSEKS